jgi:cell division protein FtsI/penicillin-binding protein 2
MAGRYFQLMVVRHEELRARARTQLTTREEVRAYRGAIRDRLGRVLALTRALPSVAVDPGKVEPGERAALAAELSARLGLPLAKVREQLGKTSRFRWLRRRIHDEEVVRAVRELRHRAIIVREELSRTHPAGALAAHLVGFTDADGSGIAGVEHLYDETLAPRFGERVVMRDGTRSSRRIAAPNGTVRPGTNGEDVVLALDLTIQAFAEEALDEAVEKWRPREATAIVMDPRNGDVLALVSRPTFDPDRRRGLDPKATRIGAVANVYEVGSTMKPLIAAAALDAGIVSLNDEFDCTASGRYRIPHSSRIMQDHKPLGHLRFPGVIIHSSNIGMAQIVAGLGIEKTYNHVRALGFGERTGSGLPGESPGVVHPKRKWTEVWSLPSIAIGHELQVTPLQFAAAFSALVNGGILYRPRIAVQIGGEPVPPEPLRGVITPETSRDLVPILVRVVDEGTGRKARVEGYAVGGKTGTARVLNKRREIIGYTSSFVGFAPAEDPRFLVFVLLSRPRRDLGVTPYGGSTAGPVAGEILARCLRYAEIPPCRRTPPVPERIATRARPSRTPAPVPPRRSKTDIDRLQFELRQREAGR